MNDNERIQDIANCYDGSPTQVATHIFELIEMVQRRDKTLEDIARGRASECEACWGTIHERDALKQQNTLMLSALEFYANQVNYMVSPLSHTQKPTVMEDFGQTARQVLTVSKQGVSTDSEDVSEQPEKHALGREVATDMQWRGEPT